MYVLRFEPAWFCTIKPHTTHCGLIFISLSDELWITLTVVCSDSLRKCNNQYVLSYTITCQKIKFSIKSIIHFPKMSKTHHTGSISIKSKVKSFVINLLSQCAVVVFGTGSGPRPSNRPLPLLPVLVESWPFSGRRGPFSVPAKVWRGSTCDRKQCPH